MRASTHFSQQALTKAFIHANKLVILIVIRKLELETHARAPTIHTRAPKRTHIQRTCVRATNVFCRKHGGSLKHALKPEA